MNDVKQLFETALEAPAPPLAPSSSIIATARRAKRRHQAWATAALAVVGLTVASFANLAPAPGTTPGTTPGPGRGPGKDLSATIGPTRLAELHAHRATLEKQIAALTTALPQGATIKQTGGEFGGLSEGPIIGTLADVRVGDRVGQLLLYQVPSVSPTPIGNLCAWPWTDSLSGHLFVEDHASCDTIQVGDVSIRVGTINTLLPSDLTTIAPTRYAARYGDGWMIVVAEQPFNNDNFDHPLPMLTTPVFTLQQLAAIAADPTLIPAD